MKSKNRKAEEFQEFITEEVLPSIRKNGKLRLKI
jgi:prophage antirepressor-like protein